MTHTFFVFRPDPLGMNKQTFEAQYPSLAGNEIISNYVEGEGGMLSFASARFKQENAPAIEASCEPIYSYLLTSGIATPDAERGWEDDGKGRSYKVAGVVWLYYGPELPAWWQYKAQPMGY